MNIVVVVERLQKLGQTVEGGASLNAVRKLLQAIVGRAVVDLETQSLDLELRLPQSLIKGDAKSVEAALCLVDASLYKTSNQAQWEISLTLAVFHCQSMKEINRPACFDCRRAA